MSATVLLLGAGGRAGRVAARLLLQHTGAQVVLAGRDGARLEALAATLAPAGDPARLATRVVDATDETALTRALEGVQLLFDCGPTALFSERLARACLAAGADCLDIHPTRSSTVLRPLAGEIARAGRCFVTLAGLHPGMPAAMLRAAAAPLARPTSAAAGLLFRIGRVPDPGAAVELVEELGSYKGLLWSGGAWRAPSWSHTRRFDFGPGFGPVTCYPLWSDELEGLPERLGLAEAGFYVSGFNWLADYVVTPLAIGLGAIRRGLAARPLARLLAFSVDHVARPPFAIVLTAEARGETPAGPRTVRVRVRSDDDDGYGLTAMPAVACARQLLEDGIGRPGLHAMGQLVAPDRLLEDLRRMGVGVDVQVGA